jgi:hypothetical protein
MDGNIMGIALCVKEKVGKSSGKSSHIVGYYDRPEMKILLPYKRAYMIL